MPKRTCKSARPMNLTSFIMHRKNPGEAVARARFCSYRRWAKIRKVPFKLTFEQFKTIVAKPCCYCGRPPEPVSMPKRHGSFICNGIDRVKNQLGYTMRNSAPCCRWCNQAKSNFTLEEFLEHIKRIWAHSASKSEISSLG